MRRSAAALAALAVLLGSVESASGAVGEGSSGGPAVDPRPDVILITIDTLRPDALGWIGGGEHTPVLDAIAATSARFAAAVSPAPLTAPAHASILTGLDPPHHGLRVNGDVVETRGLSIAERLGAAGWATGAFVSGYPLRSEFGLDRGFAFYDDELGLDAAGRWADRDAFETARLATAWVSARQGPVLAWVHLYDPHEPYEPPARFRQPGPRGDYLGEVAKVDAAIGELLAALAVSRAGRPQVLVITADHGESLGEHGEATHGIFVYDSTITVPLLIRAPGKVVPRRIDAPARLVDLAATIEALVGLPSPRAERDGLDLVPLLAGRAQPVPAAWIESLEPLRGYGWAPLTGLRSATHKLIAAPRPELYDLRADPGETRNVVDEERRQARRLEAELRERERSGVSSRSSSAIDSEGAAALAALGYASAGPLAPVRGRSLPDPKDRVQARNRFQEAERARSRGETARARTLWLEALEIDPGSPLAEMRLGQLALDAGRLEEAVRRLGAAHATAPDNPEIAYQWADALSRAGRTVEAIRAWRVVVDLQPRRAVAWSNLGAMLVRSGDYSGAAAALAEAVELDPGDAVVARNLSTVRLELAGRLAVAGKKKEAEQMLGLVLAATPELRPVALRDPRLRPLLADQ